MTSDASAIGVVYIRLEIEGFVGYFVVSSTLSFTIPWHLESEIHHGGDDVVHTWVSVLRLSRTTRIADTRISD